MRDVLIGGFWDLPDIDISTCKVARIAMPSAPWAVVSFICVHIPYLNGKGAGKRYRNNATFGI